MLEKLMKPVLTTAVDNVARRGEKAVARETSNVVAKDVARKVLGQDARIVAKEAAGAVSKDLPKIAVEGKLKLVAGGKFPIEAPRLSPDKKLVAYGTSQEHWLPEWFKNLIGLPKDQNPDTLRLYLKAADGTGEPKKVAGRTLKNAVQPAFSPDGKALVFLEQKHGIGSGERLQEMRLKSMDMATGQMKTLYDGHPTLLHPQYSPDGSKIVAYSRTPGHEGLYMLDAKDLSKAPTRLTTSADKHPIFSADGKKLFFHNQAGGNAGGAETEKAFIGMLDLTDPRAPKRTMLDSATAEVYHKHPSPIANSDLVMYHAKDPGSKPHLEVLDTKTGDRARLALDGTSQSGAKLKDFKHPAMSDDGQSLLVVAKPKKDELAAGVKDDWALYKLDGAQSIIAAFKKAFAK